MTSSLRPEFVIRVMLVEDDPLAQQAIKTYLSRSADIELVGVAGDGVEALELAPTVNPDVAIVDIHMPRMGGIELTERLTTPPSSIRVVCFTALGDDRVMLQALNAGASGFLLKSDSPGLILHGVRSAFSGDALVSPKLVAAALANRRGQSSPPPDLSATDKELLGLIGRGLSNAEIAQDLYVSEATVKTHVSNLLQKLGARDRVAAVVYAHRHGLA